MPGLLVSVRSADEARIAAHAGASVIDVKEPSRGPLGRASTAIWRAVRSSVALNIPVSVALGELTECELLAPLESSAWGGIAWRKLGLAGLADSVDWSSRWSRLQRDWESETRWIAVAYVDAERAAAPGPAQVLDCAIEHQCVGILFDTFDKSCPGAIEPSPYWHSLVEKARSVGLIVALAGSIDEYAIDRLRPLKPDLFAVRGAACRGNKRDGTIDSRRVQRLAHIAGN